MDPQQAALEGSSLLTDSFPFDTRNVCVNKFETQRSFMCKRNVVDAAELAAGKEEPVLTDAHLKVSGLLLRGAYATKAFLRFSKGNLTGLNTIFVAHVGRSLQILQDIAATGTYIHSWELLRRLIAIRLTQVRWRN